MKRNEDIASDMIDELRHYLSVDLDDDAREEFVAYFSEFLSKFSREVITDDREKRTADEIYKLSYERGRRDGLEEAANTAEGCREGFCVDAIRALKTDGGK